MKEVDNRTEVKSCLPLFHINSKVEIFKKHQVPPEKYSGSMSYPSGNQVDGLPLVAVPKQGDIEPGNPATFGDFQHLIQ